MPLPELSVRHVATRSALPSTLVQGRAYFIEDEGTIVVNHGDGGIDYGAAVKSETNRENIGTMSSLITPQTSDLVTAVNSVHEYVEGFENMPIWQKRKLQIRGECIGTHPTAAQLDSIKNGTFDDMYLGDYWEDEYTYEHYDESSLTRTLRWTIVDFYTTRVTVWCSTSIMEGPFWDANTMNHGYRGSFLYTTIMPKVFNVVQQCFGNYASCAQWIYPNTGIPAATYYTSQLKAERAYIPLAYMMGVQPYVHNDVAARRNALDNILIDPHWSRYTWAFSRISGLSLNSGNLWLAEPTANGTYAIFLNNHFLYSTSSGTENYQVCPFTFIYGEEQWS